MSAVTWRLQRQIVGRRASCTVSRLIRWEILPLMCLLSRPGLDSISNMSGRSGKREGRAERLALQGVAYGAGKGTRTPDPLLGKPKARGTPVLPEPRSALSSTGFGHALYSRGIANKQSISTWSDS